ncbi:uncharacterized protein LOC144859138 [Branchiostoma floridae x Branchiostoma japonicum]
MQVYGKKKLISHVSSQDDSKFIGNGWERIPGRNTYVSVGKLGVWGVNSAGEVYYRVGSYGNEGKGTGWKKVDGTPMKHISVGRDIVWALNTHGGVHKRIGVSSANPGGLSWEVMEGSFRTLHASSSSGAVWGVGSSGRIFKLVKEPPRERWRRLGYVARGLKFNSISAGRSGVWAVHDSGLIYHLRGTYGNEDSFGERGGLTLVPGRFKHLSVGNGIVWGTNSKGEIYYWRGDPTTTRENKWKKIDGNKAYVHVSSTTNHLWGVNGIGHVYMRTGISSSTAKMKRENEVEETLQTLRDVLEDPGCGGGSRDGGGDERAVRHGTRRRHG